MTSENKDNKNSSDTRFDRWARRIVGCWWILCIPGTIIYIIQTDTVKEIYDPCT